MFEFASIWTAFLALDLKALISFKQPSISCIVESNFVRAAVKWPWIEVKSACVHKSWASA